MKLSDQALAAIMMALQNALMNQTDIVPVLKGFDLMMDDKEEVIILNPPTTVRTVRIRSSRFTQ